MKKTLILVAALFAVAASAASMQAPAEAFESNFPTYVLSDDSAANPQPFEANYPVQITPLRVAAAPEAFESNFPTYVLSCSYVTPAPFENCYPVQIKR